MNLDDILELFPPAKDLAQITADGHTRRVEQYRYDEEMRTESARRDLYARINRHAELGSSCVGVLSPRLSRDKVLLNRLRALGYGVSIKGEQLTISWE